MSIVVDASVAVKWVISEADSAAADALFDLDQDLVAPDLWLIEAANVLWRLVRIGDISSAEAIARLDELSNAPLVSVACAPYLHRALQLGTELRHPVYDCVYLALAIAENTHLVTADRRFVATTDRPGFSGRVRLLGA